jgi:hypothetical protein
LIFFSVFLHLCWIPLLCPALSSLFHSPIYLYSPWIHSGVCVLFNYIDYFYDHSFEFCVWGFIYFTIICVCYCGVSDFRELCCPVLKIHIIYIHICKYVYICVCVCLSAL